ncbi:MAG: ribosome maturation factor RimP [Gammaproteobacteria bacterium]|nr:MAG: ribosome maturation factor RimP [Gammaproteobacteria bacterium]|tara:strand:- start:215 stop:676 length:462 start_codon:yes stop_codon:yes gene_type:complete
MDVKEKIKSLLENDINDLGYIIWGLEISGNSSSKLVRLFIDKTNGNIDLFDCEKVSNQAIEILNNSDFIDFKYRLEVSSPGIDRSFFGFEQHKEFIGNLIEVKFRIENKNKTIRGELIEFDKDFLQVKLENDNYEKIKSSNYLSSKLIYQELI